jgi:hypothetical protein
MKRPWLRVAFTALAFLVVPLKQAGADELSLVDHRLSPLAVNPDGSGGYTFDTGIIRGRLHHAGKALGLTEVVHLPSGRSLSGPYGLLSPYRVFSGNRRFGDAAWDWPSTTRLLDDTTVEIRWAAAPERPFELHAVYRWPNPVTVEAEFTVKAQPEMPAFELFLASYFDGAFTDPFVYVTGHPETQNQPGLLPARKEFGDWQMFPRDAAAVSLVTDGRWQIEPHPVDWAILPRLAAPLAVRRAGGAGLLGALMASAADCFAVSTPYTGETHYSIYLSLFGHDLPAGQERRAKARLVISKELSDAEIIERYGRFP